MTTATFQPPKEHLGLIKTQFGDTNLAQHAGFTEAYTALYTKGNSLVESLAINYEATYTWRSASFFTGIDTNLADYLTPVREVFNVVLVALDLVSNVLSVLDTLLTLSANILKTIVNKVLDLLLEILSILNPELSCHMLVIPPRIGNIHTPDPVIKDTDSITVRSAKISENTRRDFARYLNNLSTKLPAALSADVTKLVEHNYRSNTGYKYLLETLETKLADKTDAGNPSLKKYSKWDGVGIFIGSSAVNQVLSGWQAMTSLFSKSVGLENIKYGTLPPRPIIVENKIPALNNIIVEDIISEDESYVSSIATVVRPIKPTSYTVAGGIPYYFETRLVCVSPVDAYNAVSNLVAEVEGILTTEVNKQVTAETKYLTSDYIISYSYTVISDNDTVTTKRVTGTKNKLDDGDYYIFALDFYSLGDKVPDYKNKYIYLMSEVSKFSCKSDTKSKMAQGVFSWRLPTTDFLDSSSIAPSWLAASTSLQFLPEVSAIAHAFLVNLAATIRSLLDDALDWIKSLLQGLQKIIEAYSLILKRIDAILELLQQLINITASLGASVVRFSGEGDSKTMMKVFNEYLDPNISSSVQTSGTPSELDIKRSLILNESDRLQAWAEAEKESAVDALIVREGSSEYDATGSVKLVADSRKYVQDKELAAILDPQQDVVSPALSAAYNSSFNMSPIFTEEMTTAGLILLGHDTLGRSMYAWKTLLDLLFGEDEPATDETQQTILANSGILVDLPNLYPTEVSATTTVPPMIFTADMQLTEDPNQSPFSFCPSDK